jgi:hypothetical protein
VDRDNPRAVAVGRGVLVLDRAVATIFSLIVSVISVPVLRMATRDLPWQGGPEDQ